MGSLQKEIHKKNIYIYEMMFNHSINQENVNINHEI